MSVVDLIIGGTKTEVMKSVKKRGYTGHRYKVDYARHANKTMKGHYWTAEVYVFPVARR